MPSTGRAWELGLAARAIASGSDNGASPAGEYWNYNLGSGVTLLNGVEVDPDTP